MLNALHGSVLHQKQGLFEVVMKAAKRSVAVGTVAKRPLLMAGLFTILFCGAFIAVMVAFIASSLAGVSTAAAARYWALYGSPESAVIPFSLDFSAWGDEHFAKATMVPWTTPRHMPTAKDECPADSNDCPGRWHQLLSSSALAFVANHRMNLKALVELPDEMQNVGMITVAVDVFGLSGDGRTELRVLRGVGSAALRRRSYAIHVLRSLALLLPRVIFGTEVNTQILEVPLVSGFEPPADLARRISTLNITLVASRWRDDFVCYDTRLAVDVELNAWPYAYFQRYPVLSFAVVSIFFTVIYICAFGTVLAAAALLAWSMFDVPAPHIGDVASVDVVRVDQPTPAIIQETVVANSNVTVAAPPPVVRTAQTHTLPPRSDADTADPPAPLNTSSPQSSPGLVAVPPSAILVKAEPGAGESGVRGSNLLQKTPTSKQRRKRRGLDATVVVNPLPSPEANAGA